LLVWYLLMTEWLPDADAALSVFGLVYLSKGGLAYPVPVWEFAHGLALLGAVLGGVGAWVWSRAARAHFQRTGRPRPVVLPGLGMMLLGLVLGWAAGGAPTALNIPSQAEAAVVDGTALTPEFLSVLFGLVFYTAAFVAEVVRAGIASVPRGQTEAASSLGLSRGQAMRLIALPQALRVIIPPATNQYLNLTKNSSLAVAIGYPDVVSISNTAINQTGRAVECIAIIMLVYLTTSLSTSALMNWYNRRAAIKER
jgi:general L-amino acid transport system permease protein